MKMKEKKTEEVVEEVVEPPKISDELREYLEFARYALHQIAHFKDIINKCGYYPKAWNLIFESYGIDITKPVNIKSGFGINNAISIINSFVEEWIDRYNSLDLSKYDNYTNRLLSKLTPDPIEIEYLKIEFKKCAQPTTEK